ncbi:MAG: DUF2934 domain-containing protein [Tepidisphaerales bacterium]
MARQQNTPKLGTAVNVAPAPALSKTTTPVRNTTIPPVPARTPITRELIAQRAYYISISGHGGSEVDNWLRAERELKALAT